MKPWIKSEGSDEAEAVEFLSEENRCLRELVEEHRKALRRLLSSIPITAKSVALTYDMGIASALLSRGEPEAPPAAVDSKAARAELLKRVRKARKD